MDANDARRLTEQAFEELRTALAAGRSDALTRVLAAMARFHRYSARNVVLILAQQPAATQVAGFSTWRKLGRTVRRGERGIAILAPLRYRHPAGRAGADGNVPEGARAPPGSVRDEDAGASLVEACNESVAVADVERPGGFRVAYVFDVLQTDGAPLPAMVQVAGDPGAYTQALKSVLARCGIRLEYTPAALYGALGTSRGGAITVMAGQTSAAEFSVLVHELAHELLHHAADSPKNRTVVETEAEAVAHVVCTALGLSVGTASSDYINLYHGIADTLAASLARIQSTAAQLLRELELGDDVRGLPARSGEGCAPRNVRGRDARVPVPT